MWFFIILVIGFIGLDVGRFYLKKKTIDEAKKKEVIYEPNLKIWGLGGILGIGGFLLKSLSIFEKEKILSISASDCWQTVIFKLGGICFILALIGFLLLAIVKIVKED